MERTLDKEIKLLIVEYDDLCKVDYLNPRITKLRMLLHKKYYEFRYLDK